MITTSCYESSCREQPLFSCSCNKYLYVCQLHITKHFLLTGVHTLTSIVTLVPENKRNSIMEYLKIKKRLMIQNINNLINYSKELINLITSQTKKAIEKLNIQKINLNYMIEAFYKTSMINKDIIEAVNYGYHNYEKAIDLDLNETSNFIKRNFGLMINSHLAKDDDFAIIFKSNYCNQIGLVNLETFRKSTINFSVSDLVQFCGCCKIGEYKYFTYGGYSSSPSNSTKIIDIKMKTVELLPSDSPNQVNGLCLFKEEVYCFGGYNTSAINICKKFDLNKRVWIIIQTLPEFNHNTSASTLGDQIIVCGCQSQELYNYNPVQNVFSNSKYRFIGTNFKYIFENWIVVFGNSLFEIDENLNLIKRQEFKETGTHLNSSQHSKREIVFTS